MNDSLVWLSASLACLLSLSLLSGAACLFLIRRAHRASQSEQSSEQRLIQLALDLRRLDQRVRELEGLHRDNGPAADSTERAAPPSLISIPDMSRPADGETDEAANLALKHADVWSMAERGLGAAEIARSTGRPIGQVELIVGLHRRHNALRSAGDHAKTT